MTLVLSQKRVTDFLPKISVLIPTHNRRKLLIELLESLSLANYPKNRLEVIVIDDASQERLNDTIKKFKDVFARFVLVRNRKSILKSGCINAGAKIAGGDYLLIIDDDNIVSDDCLLKLITAFKRLDDSACVVAPVTLIKGTDVILYCGAFYHRVLSVAIFPHRFEHYRKIKNVNFIETEVTPNVFMVKKQDFLAVGGFDEKEFPICDEDGEFQLRLKKSSGKKIFIIPQAKVYHPLVRYGRFYPLRTYYMVRNKIKLIKRHKPARQLIAFLIFSWLYFAYYSIIFARLKKIKYNLMAFLKGWVAGFS